ncbi:signal peptidase I [Phosphitispora sp. TUW77]|uniref:signal peptidase I n=1 Tax=Phosphitispora sp. TUW77 TaxID=3152361 RepID=UPI003AB8178D
MLQLSNNYSDNSHDTENFSQKAWGFLKDVLQVLFFALILTFLLRSFVIEARLIPSESMLPTLEIGDRLLVDKIAFKFEELERTDIIVFAPPPEAQRGMVKEDLIKRIIGLPGDTVEVKEGMVFINNNSLEETYIAERINYTYGPVVVPEGYLFVMGDNRNYSFDSHEWGFLPLKNIKGRAFFRFWPAERVGLLD